MKKILVSFLTVFLFLTAAKAESFDVVLNGSPGGTYHQRTTLLVEALKSAGHQVEIVEYNKWQVAAKYIQETKKPSIMVWSTTSALAGNLVHTKKNFVAIEYISPMFLCATKDGQNKKEIKVGYLKGIDPTFYVNWLKKQGKVAKVLPYENSGSMLQAMLGGDLDYKIQEQSKSKQYMSKEEGTCIFNSSDKEVIGVPSVTKFGTKVGPIAIRTIVGYNIDADKMRDIVLPAIRKSSEFSEWHQKNEFVVLDNANTRAQELKLAQKSEQYFKPYTAPKLKLGN